MAASVPPNPKLGKSQALNTAQATTTRLANLIPSVSTDLSPVTVYQPGVAGGTGNELTAAPGLPVNVSSAYGVWVAPDLNGDGSEWYATVECFGAGGGGGGGNGIQGGGGGGAGEYACETQYRITPGAPYAYAVGLPGSGGYNTSSVNAVSGAPGSAGTSGGGTVFDTGNGVSQAGLAGGVVANGGGGGDMTSVGIGGSGGTGSGNSVHFNGGSGGTNVSGNGSDNPVSLARAAGMFAGNTLSPGIVQAWYIENDSNLSGTTRNDASGNNRTGTWTNYTGGKFETAENQPAAPAQVPAYTSPAGTYGPNATTAGWSSKFYASSFSAACARFACGGLTSVSGTKFTVSGWIQATQLTWGDPVTGAYAVVAANNINYTSASFKGFALYFHNSAGIWTLNAVVGNGTTRYAVSSTAVPPTPSTWYYMVMTYNSGTLSLYVNGALAASTTTTGYTSVPAGAYATVMGLDPHVTANWFFGAVSNFWFASDCLTLSGVQQAYGLTPATGGAGGGASGGPSTAGGNGATGSGATGGAGGVPATQPASLSGVTTAAQGGYAGANSGSGDSGASTPAGGPYGGGGGGSGKMGTPPAVITLTVPFSTAAAYNGTDAAAGPSSPYNVNQQANPASLLNTLLYAGGQPTDTDTGSKNSLLLLPSNLAASLGNGHYTITGVFLTFTNAYPTNTVESVLEVAYTSDTSLPQTYTGASSLGYVGAVPIPSGAGEITYDLTQTGLPAKLQNGTATALMLGPGATPTFDAYNAPFGVGFYNAVYGPGAHDAYGNAQYPYLTITLQKTLVTQRGSNGTGGGIRITSVSNSNVPVVFVQPYAGTDANGNQFAQGYTGPTTAFDPTVTTPGSYVPESWKGMSLINNWTQQGGSVTAEYHILPDGALEVTGVINTNGGTVTSRTFATLPSQYWAATAGHTFSAFCVNSPTTVFAGSYDNAGNLSISGAAVTSSYEISFSGRIPLT